MGAPRYLRLGRAASRFLDTTTNPSTPPTRRPGHYVSGGRCYRRLSLTQTSPLDPGIMPPVLHPKSRMTSSLFATTVAACFLVVTMPHLLPCPVPRARFADGEIMVDENGRRMRWKKKDSTPKVEDGIVQFNDMSTEDVQQGKDRVRRECPVPKPGGMLGEWLGFHKSEIETRAGR
ncbi:hypothetical protein CDV36_007996 [Fusarium kuroshium]|uniref:Uncharacterized protein n=1 Tax=Fusarium kuroshium TaxID=2010991 RepID=A0A3M2S517_9HYPO|nr:hypothetical protein CDV36_007996 [Fusarium kuroshium]